MSKTVFFIFAHQDDEMGVFPILEKTIRENKKPVCVYLTSGAKNDQNKSSTREKESTRVLTKLGIELENIYFLGARENIADGELIYNMKLTAEALLNILKSYENISELYVHAYEGGHHDHDAAFVLATYSLKKLSLEAIGRQFPMYRASQRKFMPYVVNATLKNGGAFFKASHTRMAGLKYLSLTLNYRSQWKSMLGLVPFYLFYWLFFPGIKYQKANLRLASKRPHEGDLLYEKHKRFSYGEFEYHVTDLLALDTTSHN